MVMVFTVNALSNSAANRLFSRSGRRRAEGDEEGRRGADQKQVQEPNRYIDIIIAGREVEIAVIKKAGRFALSAEIDCQRGQGLVPSRLNGEAGHDQPGGKQPASSGEGKGVAQRRATDWVWRRRRRHCFSTSARCDQFRPPRR